MAIPASVNTHCRKYYTLFFTFKDWLSAAHAAVRFPKTAVGLLLFSRWKEDGRFEEIHENLRDKCRERQEKRRPPNVGLLSSQSVKATRM
ncbi:MAG: hypothetical protein LBL90_05730 [Prevotellaceae bacterium]|nr:hypothetical protein [Prevotellaceae bacterium]